MAKGRIFISYRRGEDSHVTGRLHDRLESSFDRDQLFIDIDAVPPGVDFVEHIDAQLADCSAFLAVIGPGWINNIDRLQDPDDFVRIEIEAALKRDDLPIIPILVDTTRMPEAELLPSTLRPFARRSGVTLPHEHFGAVVDGRLANELKRNLGRRERHTKWIAAALFFVLAMAVVAWFLLRQPTPGEDVDLSDTSDVPEIPVAHDLNGSIEFRSEAGDYIGDGRHWSLDNQEALISATFDGNLVSVTIDGDDHWSLDFAAPADKPLISGTYANASRYPFNSPKKPGLSISGAGRGCNTLAGSFTIHELQVSETSGEITVFRAGFEQWCDESQSALRGDVDLRRADAEQP